MKSPRAGRPRSAKDVGIAVDHLVARERIWVGLFYRNLCVGQLLNVGEIEAVNRLVRRVPSGWRLELAVLQSADLDVETVPRVLGDRHAVRPARIDQLKASAIRPRGAAGKAQLLCEEAEGLLTEAKSRLVCVVGHGHGNLNRRVAPLDYLLELHTVQAELQLEPEQTVRCGTSVRLGLLSSVVLLTSYRTCRAAPHSRGNIRSPAALDRRSWWRGSVCAYQRLQLSLEVRTNLDHLGLRPPRTGQPRQRRWQGPQKYDNTTSLPTDRCGKELGCFGQERGSWAECYERQRASRRARFGICGRFRGEGAADSRGDQVFPS